jgi:hypothetical protein
MVVVSVPSPVAVLRTGGASVGFDLDGDVAEAELVFERSGECGEQRVARMALRHDEVG